MKLREIEKLTEATLNAQAVDRAQGRFNSTVISELLAGIEQGLNDGTIVSINAQSAAPAGWPSGTNTWTVNQQSPTQSPAQTRQQKQAMAAQTAQSQMAQNATAAPNVAQQAAQTRQQKQATAAQSAQSQMVPVSPKPKVWRSGRNPNGPSFARENTQFEKLNSLIESIININELAGAPKSISQYVQAQLPVITKSDIFNTSPYKESIQKLADEVESTYANDKGQGALNKLAEFSWNALTQKAPGRGFSSQRAAPVTTNAAPQQTATTPQTPSQPAAPAATATPAAAPAEIQQSKVGVRQINKIIPTLRKRDLLSVKKNVDNTLSGRGASETPAVNTGANAFGQMAGQLSGSNKTKSSTGGTTTKTPTGLVHSAKPKAEPQVAAAPKDNTIKMPKGKVRASREGGVTPEEQAKFDEKVRQAMANQKE